MSGTKIGGQKARETNYKKHGADFYARIGREGGKKGHTGGFAANPQLAVIAGRKGGLISSKSPQISLEERRREINDMLRQEEELTFYEVS